MAEEIKDGQEPQEPQFTEIEQRAMEQGWRPKDEWDGEPDAWRGAKEFLDRGEFFKKIEDQNRVIKELRKTQSDFAKHYERMKKVEFDRALEMLRKEKREALIENDVDAVMAIDEKMEEVREQRNNIEVPEVPDVAPTLNPIFVNWVERNSWYEKNEAMRAYADRVGTRLGASGMAPNDVLAEVERAVKKEFASKFENPNRNKPGAVEGGANKKNEKRESFQMTDDERRVMQRFVRTGAITEEQYVKDLKEAKARGL